MSKQLYLLALDNYAMPAFTSFSKHYFGTLEDIGGFVEALRATEENAKHENRLIGSRDRYMAGDHNATYNAAYQDGRLLVRVKCLGTAESMLSNHEWEHLNTWEWPYYMRCTKAESTHVWLSYQGSYVRCIRTRFSNLEYKNTQGKYTAPSGCYWGYPHQIEEEDSITYNRMYVIEKTFKHKTEALLDMENFKAKPDIEFREVLNSPQIMITGRSSKKQLCRAHSREIFCRCHSRQGVRESFLRLRQR